MNLSRKTKIIIVIVALVTSFAVGRYSVPEKVKIETKVVEVEKKVTDQDKDSHTHEKKVVVEIDKPDGEKQITTTTTQDNTSEDKMQTTDNIDKKTDSTKEVVKGDSKVTISALGGWDLNKSSATYGLSITKPILGPITMGAWGLASGNVGVSLGLQF